MNQKSKWIIIIFTLCCFSKISFANTATFQKELDDFSWSLGSQYEQGLSPALFDDISAFTNKHRKDYQKARTESLKKWQVSKINTSGFQQISTYDLDAYSQELAKTPASNINENFSMPQHWKVLNVQSMTSMITDRTWPLLSKPPLDFSVNKISYLIGINYLFGMRFNTVALENDVWEVWAYSHALTYRYRWDLRQNQIKDFSIWLKEEFLE